jgi:hypothetical protein
MFKSKEKKMKNIKYFSLSVAVASLLSSSAMVAGQPQAIATVKLPPPQSFAEMLKAAEAAKPKTRQQVVDSRFEAFVKSGDDAATLGKNANTLLVEAASRLRKVLNGTVDIGIDVAIDLVHLFAVKHANSLDEVDFLTKNTVDGVGNSYDTRVLFKVTGVSDKTAKYAIVHKLLHEYTSEVDIEEPNADGFTKITVHMTKKIPAVNVTHGSPGSAMFDTIVVVLGKTKKGGLQYAQSCHPN